MNHEPFQERQRKNAPAERDGADHENGTGLNERQFLNCMFLLVMGHAQVVKKDTAMASVCSDRVETQITDQGADMITYMMNCCLHACAAVRIFESDEGE